MSLKTLQQGIELIRQGHKTEGARLLKIALRSEEIQGEIRATAYLWLAETVDETSRKLEYYNLAISADPNNEHAKKRISELMAKNLPPIPPPQQAPPEIPVPPTATPTTYTAQSAVDYNNLHTGQEIHVNHQIVGIMNGPNGIATAFFISRNGILATTRFAVGGLTSVMLSLSDGNRIQADVVRSYPEFDLAFLHANVNIAQLLPVSPKRQLESQESLTAVSFTGHTMKGVLRPTKSLIKDGWFPTTISTLVDVGGNPVFDRNNNLVGMLTNNANRSSPYVYGLSIHKIYHLVEQYAQEMRNAPQTSYCPGCGCRSKAGGYGGFYCEHCGATLPEAQDIQRSFDPKLAGLYGENMSRPCPRCHTSIGFYKGTCLRCGYQAR
ncbi:MAG: hypothetical protein Kow00117_01360 [Phototrophicales bacterium]